MHACMHAGNTATGLSFTLPKNLARKKQWALGVSDPALTFKKKKKDGKGNENSQKRTHGLMLMLIC